MAYWLPRTEAALEECRRHLAETSSYGTPVESYLTSHLVVMLCGEVESAVRKLVHGYVQRTSSEEVSQFVRKVGGNIVRNAKHSEVKDVLGYFGREYSDEYERIVRTEIGDAGINSLGNAVASRNDITHNTPPKLTFNEVVSAHSAGEQVLEAVAAVVQDGGTL